MRYNLGLQNLTIGMRLAIGFGLLMVLATIQGFWGVSYMGVLNVRMDHVYTRNLLEIKGLSGMQSDLYRMRVDVLNHILSRSGGEMAQLTQDIQRQRQQIEAVLEQYKSTPRLPVEQKLFDNYQFNFKKYAASITHDVLSPSTAGDKSKAMAMFQDRVAAEFRTTHDVLNDLIDYNNNIARTGYEYAMADYKSVSSRVLGLIVTIVVVGIVISVWVTHSITRPIKAAVNIANRVATGDLTGRIKIKTRDETGELLTALKKMNDDLTEIVRQARCASESIVTTTQGISTGNADLAQRTGEQSASLEETASSMEELTATVRHNADNSIKVNEAAQSSRASAQDGATRMGEVVKTISRINDSSRQITGVIGVINEIAFQTNLLALNAAVEAARAGEHGRGFGVVAGEVRALAQRCATAAKEIKSLITESEATINEGSKFVDQARTSMDGIVAQVERVSTLIQEISHASGEQSQSIEHINIAITQLGDNTQRNAALAEETTAAISMLMEQAEHLVHVVKIFKIADAPEPRGASDSTNQNQPAKTEPPVVTEVSGRPVSAPPPVKRLWVAKR
ncbi:MAG TPA: methyl-accepting chemotaxis protein [Candidatus Methylomirabilis sp.]|nr:methyl-accepting chemotaxis protein [Candidatus Methylomirabilis sp.]